MDDELQPEDGKIQAVDGTQPQIPPCPLDVTKCVSVDETSIASASFNKPCRPISRDFMKMAIISPDGTRVLASTEANDIITWLIDVNVIASQNYYSQISISSTSSSSSSSSVSSSSSTTSASSTNDFINIQPTTSAESFKPLSSASFSVGESIYDFQWYPFMSSSDEATCCFISTSRDHPIHLWDANNPGVVRCSYSCYDSKDELEAANCITFNLTGEKIFSGSARMIRSFDVSYPGRTCTEYPTCTTRRDQNGQRGIISCLKFNPDYSGAYAAGSYANNITIYAENMRGAALTLNELEFGVTHMKWSPDGCKLWAGGRAHGDVVCWDLRHTRCEIGRVKRSLNTNQRMQFDLDPWGKYLATGTQDGKLLVYGTENFELMNSLQVSTTCLNSTTFHPYSSLLVACSGERQFEGVEGCDDDDESDEEKDEDGTMKIDHGIGNNSSSNGCNSTSTPTRKGGGTIHSTASPQSSLHMFAFDRKQILL